MSVSITGPTPSAKGRSPARRCSASTSPYDRPPYFFTDQYDLGMEYTGYVEPDGYDEVIFRGDLESGEFIAYWLADRRVHAGMNVNIWDVAEHIEALVRSRGSGRRAPADPDVPMTEALTERGRVWTDMIGAAGERPDR